MNFPRKGGYDNGSARDGDEILIYTVNLRLYFNAFWGKMKEKLQASYPATPYQIHLSQEVRGWVLTNKPIIKFERKLITDSDILFISFNFQHHRLISDTVIHNYAGSYRIMKMAKKFVVEY